MRISADYSEEAELEGVRGEVVYVQAMLETGWLQFGGDAVESQYNFSGLGTTGGGVQEIPIRMCEPDPAPGPASEGLCQHRGIK